jgi:disulfide bond formation protein DsbB
MNRSVGVTLNALGLYGIALVLIAAFAGQILLGELPCPLCLLQRVLFAMLAIGPILNIRFGSHPGHYALSLLAAIVGATVSARQILLHIMPRDPGYGSALLGYHYYTWAFIAFAAAIVLIAIVLLFDDRQRDDKVAGRDDEVARPVGLFASAAVWLVIGLTAINAVSTLLECGFGACPDNPTFYELLRRTP